MPNFTIYVQYTEDHIIEVEADTAEEAENSLDATMLTRKTRTDSDMEILAVVPDGEETVTKRNLREAVEDMMEGRTYPIETLWEQVEDGGDDE